MSLIIWQYELFLAALSVLPCTRNYLWQCQLLLHNELGLAMSFVTAGYELLLAVSFIIVHIELLLAMSFITMQCEL